MKRGAKLGRIPPYPGSFVKSVKTKELEHFELGRIYGRLENDETL
jgi:hypothetical protein